jgi:general secretion pathway protein C
MGPFLARGFPALITVLFGSAAALDAHTMLDTEGSQVAPTAAPLPRPPRRHHRDPPAAPPRSSRATSAADILARNPFESAGPTDPPRPARNQSGVAIRKVGSYAYVIDRALVDKVLEEQAELMTQARIVPESEGGKVVGIRLFGVHPGSLLASLGFENGDRLERVNGFNMGSPESALEAYARLRTSDWLFVVVSRKGTPTTLTYNIV